MKITEYIKNGLKGWKIAEIILLILVLLFIIVHAIFRHDNIIAVISAICGILYTVLAGKGKSICYLFGLCGSGCYGYLSLINAVYGNLLLYIGYYIPSQLYGFFSWNKNLKPDKNEIVKTKLLDKEKFYLIIISILGSILTFVILKIFNDSHPLIDGITTFLSIVGMFLTVKRCIEQWIIWMIVNGLSLIMWIDIVLHGTKAYSTVIMWFVYFILAFYFYFCWKKELKY
jgi:nicotinamide mononucleotide transporter